MQRSRQYQSSGTRKKAEHRYGGINIQSSGEAHNYQNGTQFCAGRDQRDSQSQ
jgi:hypothetical protein